MVVASDGVSQGGGIPDQKSDRVRCGQRSGVHIYICKCLEILPEIISPLGEVNGVGSCCCYCYCVVLIE